MLTWIFQGNPDTFDIQGYLNVVTDELMWTVSTNANEIQGGDRVFIWEAQGSGKGNAGIVAECEVLEEPRLQIDDPRSSPFWKKNKAPTEAVRARLRLKRIANKKEVLKREWLRDDSVLQNLLVLRRPAGTNFPVSETEAKRLDVLWSKIGQDWARDEVIAALHLYSTLWDKPISKTVGSPVERLGQQIGRVATGVYNKLMNLRALDPRVEQKGLPGGSKTDREVWEEFYLVKTKSIDEAKLEAEHQRLWGSFAAFKSPAPRLDDEVERLEGKSLDQLFEAYRGRASNGNPKRREVQHLIYERDALVVAITRKRAGYRCEVEGCTSPAFLTDDGERYIEAHHLVPLAQGGKDEIENTACLCPTHHREVHHGRSRRDLTASLLAKRMPKV